MKLAIFLVLSWFIASNCTATTIQTLKRISEGQYGKTLLDTIELELNSNSKEDPRPRILHLLEDIKEEAQEAIDALNQRNDAQTAQCESEQTSLQDAIDGLKGQIQSDTQEISSKSSEVDAVTQARDAKQAIVDTLQPYLDQITAQRQQEQSDFETEDNRRAQIIAVLEKTRQFITDRLEARQEEGTSFLEKENVLIQVKETVLSAEFQKVSPGWGQLIAFLATKALNKMKQDEDAQAVAGLQSIVDLINQIISDTTVFRNNAQAANNAEQEAFDQESADVSNQLTLARADISADDANLSGLNDRVNELKAAVASNGDLVSDKQDELTDSQTRCQQAAAEYSDAFTARNDQLNLIDEVIAIVTNDLHGLRDYTENTIANADIEVSESSDN